MKPRRSKELNTHIKGEHMSSVHPMDIVNLVKEVKMRLRARPVSKMKVTLWKDEREHEPANRYNEGYFWKHLLEGYDEVEKKEFETNLMDNYPMANIKHVWNRAFEIEKEMIRQAQEVARQQNESAVQNSKILGSTKGQFIMDKPKRFKIEGAYIRKHGILGRSLCILAMTTQHMGHSRRHQMLMLEIELA